MTVSRDLLRDPCIADHVRNDKLMPDMTLASWPYYRRITHRGAGNLAPENIFMRKWQDPKCSVLREGLYSRILGIRNERLTAISNLNQLNNPSNL